MLRSKSSLRGFSFALLAALCALPEAWASTGVSDERVSLPDGPGSIGGVGENVDLNLSMGQMSYRVPIRLPRGHEGMTPDLDLQYSSGSGVGLLGIGWSFDLPTIERMTVRGLPTYSTSDLFAADGSAELVEAGSDEGAPVYRSRREGTFLRYKWHDRGAGDKGYWTAEFPDGRIGYFGADAAGKVVPEARVADPVSGATFGYHLVEMVDRFGHRMTYKYVKSGNRSLIDEIGYLHSGSTARFAVRFVYEDRPDVQSDGKAGFEVKLLKRLKEVRVFSGAEVIRSYALSYEDAATSGGLTRLEKVSELGRGNIKHPIEFSFGYSRALGGTCQSNCQKPFMVDMGTLPGGVDIKAGTATLIDINGDSLPDVLSSTNTGVHTFFLSKLSADGKPTFQGASPSAKTAGGSPFVLGAPGVQVLDINGDGMADIAATNQNPPAVLCNGGNGDWGGNNCLANAALPTLSADTPGDPNPKGVRFFDFDGDKRIDVLRTNGDNTTEVFRNDGAKFTQQLIDNIGAVFDGSTLQLADMNGDGLQDPVEILGGGQLRYRVNLGRGTWKDWVTVTLPAIDATQLQSADIEDLNGDGLADLVVVLGTELRYALNRGNDKFEPFVLVTSNEVDGDLPVKDSLTTVLYADMNGNGTDDVVWIKGSSVRFLELFPVRPNLLSRIENGIGFVQTVEYGTSAAERARDEGSEPWKYDVPSSMNVVKVTDTWVTLTGSDQGGLHDREEFSYHDGYFDGDERAFRGFARVDKLLDNDPTSDGEEPALQISDFDLGITDFYRAGLLLRERWFTGPKLDSPLREERTDYKDCALSGLPATALPVRFLCRAKHWTLLQEGKPEASWVTTAEEFTHDGFGNVAKLTQLGVVNTGSPENPGACGPCEGEAGTFGKACGPTCSGDEMVIETTYIAPGVATNKAWILDRASRRTTYADAAGPKAETVTYYDGPDFVGLPEGQLSKGKATRVSRRVDDKGFVDLQRNKFNDDGYPVEILDPLATPAGADHRRRYEYDATGSRVTAVELPLLDPAGKPYSLRRTMSHEAAFLQPSEASDWVVFEGGKPQTGANTTRYRYDEHGRSSAQIQPGDTDAAPTSAFTYDLASPFSRVVTRFRSAPGGAFDGEQIDCLDGRGRLYQQRTLVAEGKYTVTGFQVFNKRGTVVRSYQPYESASSACDTAPPDGVPFESTATDALGRPLARSLPDGSQQLFSYEPLAALRLDEEDSDGPFAGTPERAERDGLGRVVAVERLLTQGGSPARMTYRYDSRGNLARITDASGHTKEQTFDLMGRAVSVSDPNSGKTIFTLDAAGNLVQRTDADGQVVVSTFDGLLRKTAEYDPKDEAATRVEWLYDRDAGCSLCTNGAGREVGVRYPVSTDSSQGSDRSGYDTRGRRVWFARKLEGHEFVTQYAYDSRDLPIKTTHPDGTVVETKRDLAGRVTSVGGALTSVAYSERGKLSKATYANGVEASWERDERERLSGLTVSSTKAGKILGLAYTRNRTGRVTDVTDSADKVTGRPGRGVSYEYDAWYRLTSADLDAGGAAAEKLSFSYDEIDNITSRTSSNPQSPANVGQYTYDAAHPNAATSAGSLSCQYDVTGDMTNRYGRIQKWDHLGRLVSTADADGNVAGSVHGAGSSRVMKLEGGGVAYRISDSFEVRDGIGVAYSFLDGKRVARSSTVALATTVLSDVGPGGAPDGAIDISDAWLAQAAQAGVASLPDGLTASPVERLLRASARRLLLEASEPTVYLHHDALGSVVAATGADGSVLGEQDFYPNGQRRAENGHVDAYGFAGYEEDGEAGTWHTKRRELDPLLGRWLSVDPAFELIRGSNSADALAEMLSGYAYVGNDLVNAIDPAGTKKTSLNSKKPKLTKQQKGRQKQEKMRRKENKAIAKGFKSSGTDADKNVTSAYGNYKIHKMNKRARTVGGAIGSLAMLGGTIATVSISIKDLIENKSPGPGNDTSDDDATPPEDGSDSQSPEFSDPQGGAEDLPFDTSGMDPSGGQSLSEDTEQPGGKICSGGGGSSGPTEIGVVLSCN